MEGRWARLLREEGFLVVVVMIGNVGNFIFHVYMSRNLGADGYGVLTALLSLLYVLSIPTLTIQATLAQFIASESAMGNRAVAKALYVGGLKRIGLLAGLVGGAVLLGARPLQNYLHIEAWQLLGLLAALVAVSIAFPAFMAGLQGMRLFRPLGVIILVMLGLKCGLGIGLVWAGGAVASAMVALVVATGVGIIAAGAVALRAWPAADAAADADFRPLLMYTIPVSLGFLALAPYANFDIVLVRHYLPADAAGYYASAMILGKAFLFLPVGIVLALFPNVAHAVARQEDPRAFLWPALGLGCVLSLIGAVMCFAAPGLLARLLIRTAEPGILPLVRWVGFAMAPAGLSTILLQYHMARRQWSCLPGILLLAAGFVAAVIRWHGSPGQVLGLVAVFSVTVFTVLLLSVWWPASRPAS